MDSSSSKNAAVVHGDSGDDGEAESAMGQSSTKVGGTAKKPRFLVTAQLYSLNQNCIPWWASDSVGEVRQNAENKDEVRFKVCRPHTRPRFLGKSRLPARVNLSTIGTSSAR